jgi:hypothetical protein
MAHSRHRPEFILLPLALLAGVILLLLALGLGDGRAGGVDVALGAPPAAKPGNGASNASPAGAPNTGGTGFTLPRVGTPILTVRDGQRVDIHGSPGGAVVATVGDTTEFDSPTVLTVLERRGNWLGVTTQLLPNGELGWVEVDTEGIAIDSVGQSIVIDLSSMNARLFRNGDLEREWQVGIGAPDTPTPTGRFAITDGIEGGLDPTYGCCAIALSATQPNLPTGWSGGDRIAIHGTALPLGAANSTGCVHSGEDDLHALIDGVPLGTPVTIKP